MTGYDPTCQICMYAVEHGSWPPDHKGSHCPGCGRSWQAKRQSHCTECHAHFAGDSAGDAHRVNGHCLTSDEMLQKRSKSGKVLFRVELSKDGEIWRRGETMRLYSKPQYLAGD
jgi:hypothetical protein